MSRSENAYMVKANMNMMQKIHTYTNICNHFAKEPNYVFKDGSCCRKQ